MKRIGGNLQALLQVKDEGEKNAVGKRVSDWNDVTTLTGWLDLTTGDSHYNVFNTKIQDSTHIFICDYIDLSNVTRDEETISITSKNARLVIQGLVYDILLIDNPMNMNEHLEIYLRFVGD